MRVIITGASRGIGAAIAREFARRHGSGLTVALLGRSMSKPTHPSLEGTLLDTTRQVEASGAAALPMEVDLRDGQALRDALSKLVHAFDGLDVLVNNASVLVADPHPTVKEMDLLHAVNVRATLIGLQECADALAASRGSVVTVSPPIRAGRLDWISAHPAYTLSKYGMTLATLGAASDRVRANCLWPRRTVATAATRRLEEAGLLPDAFSRGRDPAVVARAVHALAVETSHNAECLFDEDLVDVPADGAPLDAFVDEQHIPRARTRGMRATCQ